MTGGPERRSPDCWGSRPARSANGSASSATRGSINSAPCTTKVIRAASGRPRSIASSRRSRKGVFHNAGQIRTWVEATFGVTYSASGVKDLLRRIGASYHEVSGFFWKADVQEQKKWVRKHRRHKREAGPGTRRYFVDACHPVWGVGLLYSCWLLVGQRSHVGVGNGRKRLNILGAYCPDDHDYVDLRLTKENITGEQFVKLLEAL